MAKSRKIGVESFDLTDLALAKVITLEMMKVTQVQVADQVPEKESNYILKKLNNIVTEITREEEGRRLDIVDNSIDELWEGLS